MYLQLLCCLISYIFNVCNVWISLRVCYSGYVSDLLITALARWKGCQFSVYSVGNLESAENIRKFIKGDCIFHLWLAPIICALLYIVLKNKSAVLGPVLCFEVLVPGSWWFYLLASFLRCTALKLYKKFSSIKHLLSDNLCSLRHRHPRNESSHKLDFLCCSVTVHVKCWKPVFLSAPFLPAGFYISQASCHV